MRLMTKVQFCHEYGVGTRTTHVVSPNVEVAGYESLGWTLLATFRTTRTKRQNAHLCQQPAKDGPEGNSRPIIYAVVGCLFGIGQPAITTRRLQAERVTYDPFRRRPSR
jgi:hypothetical protein